MKLFKIVKEFELITPYVFWINYDNYKNFSINKYVFKNLYISFGINILNKGIIYQKYKFYICDWNNFNKKFYE